MKPLRIFPPFPLHFRSARTAGWHPKEIAQYERAAIALSYVTSWDIAIDVGANVGTWSYAFANSFAAVYAFEPVPEHYAIAAQNLAAFSHVTVHPTALFDANGYGTMEQAAFAYLSFGTGETAVRTLDSFNLPSCGLVKIDTEGAEYAVLCGGRETITHHAPVIIVEEHEAAPQRYDIPCAAVYNRLDIWGYTRVWAHSPDAIYVKK